MNFLGALALHGREALAEADQESERA